MYLGKIKNIFYIITFIIKFSCVFHIDVKWLSNQILLKLNKHWSEIWWFNDFFMSLYFSVAVKPMLNHRHNNSKCCTIQKVTSNFIQSLIFKFYFLYFFNNQKWQKIKTMKSPSGPFKSCVSQTNPRAREIKLNHYGRALEAAFIRSNKWAALFLRLLKSQTFLSYIHIFTASPSTTQTRARTRVSPLVGGTAEGGSEWKEKGKKDQQTEQLRLFNQVQSERERGNRTNYWLRSGQEAELSVAACAVSSFN